MTSDLEERVGGGYLAELELRISRLEDRVRVLEVAERDRELRERGK